MNCIIHDGSVLMNSDGCAPAGPAGTYLRGAVPAQLVQDKSSVVCARLTASVKVVVARPRTTTLQKNPFMTRGAVISGASSGPHKWDPV
jgi:hypothetical protein